MVKMTGENPKTTAQKAETPPKSTYILCLLQSSKDGQFSGLDWSTYRVLKNDINRVITTDKDSTIIDLWLDSPGGSAHTAFKIMLLLRSKCSWLRVIVPEYAKSAATLMVIGADERIMSPYAELGPLDVQMEHPNRAEQYVSAIDIVRSLEKISSDSIGLVISGGAEILKRTGARRQETLTAMLKFAAEFMNPIVGKLDATLIHRAFNELQVAKLYANRLAEMRVQQDIPSIQMEKIILNITDNYPSHGFVICPSEMKKIGLPVKDIETYPDKKLLYLLYGLFESSDNSLIRAFTKPELESILNSGENNEKTEEKTNGSSTNR